MKIGRILSPVHALGPGERVCLWTQGCSKKCAGCMSTDLQGAGGADIPCEKLAMILQTLAQKGGCTGLTVSGGDPFEQSEALLSLLQAVRETFADILVYTGFTLDDITNGCAGEAGNACLAYIDVLIDGRYEKENNRPDCVLRGSSNQQIRFLNPQKQAEYTAYMQQGRMVETFFEDGQSIIIGILNEV